MTTQNRPGQTGVSAKTRRQKEAAAALQLTASRARKRRTSLAGAVVAVIVAAVIAVVLVSQTGGTGSGGGPGGGGGGATSTDPAGFDLPRLNGDGDVRLASFRGKPTVVNFFASWCTACRGELPGFARVSRELEGKVNFVGVNSLETGDGLAMARQFGVDWWPIGKDVDGQQASGLHDALGGQGMPLTAFYDANGKLLYVSPGALPEPQLRATLQHYLGVG